MSWWRNPAIIDTQKLIMQKKKVILVPAYVSGWETETWTFPQSYQQ